MTNPIVDIIYGGQYGSEGKRVFNEFYFEQFKPTAIVSNFGPNSGGFVSDGSKWATFAMGAECIHALSPGSIISTTDFEREIANLPKGARVVIHENAAIVTPEHLEQEKSLVTIGSTMTGTAAAAAQKLQRDPDNRDLAKYVYSDLTLSSKLWIEFLRVQPRIQLCTPQGHSLSINHGPYPFCTSRNTSPQQGLADAGIPIQWVRKIIACMRTFPIRVANRFDDDGNMIGWSGPCYDDQYEMTWDEVKQPPEMTSVSKKVRRVFSFSETQYLESCIMNGVTDVFMNFVNYLSLGEADDLFNRLMDLGYPATWAGYGPKTTDIASVELATYEEIEARERATDTLPAGVDNDEVED